MKPLNEFLLEMSTDIPVAVIDEQDGQGLGIDSFTLTLPIESRFDSGNVQVSLPRGRLATGFDLPRGQIKASFEKTDTELFSSKEEELAHKELIIASNTERFPR